MIIKYAKILRKYKGEILKFSLLKWRLLSPFSYISSKATITVDFKRNLHIARNVRIGNYTTIIVQSQNGLDNSRLEIGENTYIGEYNNIRAGGGIIKIGKNCSISQHISMIASNHLIDRTKLISKQAWDIKRTGIEIEDDVWIGANSVILPGVKVHHGAVIGAGSIVTKDIPSFAIVVGNPAKLIKFRD